MKTFANINKYDFFLLQGDCGIVEMMKVNGLEAVCIDSCNGTYQRAQHYAIQPDQEVNLTCKHEK